MSSSPPPAPSPLHIARASTSAATTRLPFTLGRTSAALPMIWGHRGAAHRDPDSGIVENTLAAFERARADGADGIELDVRLCASGDVVVFHDDDLVRLAGRPERIDTLDWGAIQAVELARGARIPRLDEVLERFASELVINIELKPTRARTADRLARAVVAAIARHRADSRVLISSFDPLLLAATRARAPHLPRGYLFHAEQGLALRRAWPSRALRVHALHPDSRLVTAERVRAWRRRRVSLQVWTVDQPDEIRRLAALGVDGIITNTPALARATLASK
ncbi:MAG: glycerophosphodiester phosphodiesterase family protein [Haliangiales bacterium]